jgi:hypothetical protein
MPIGFRYRLIDSAGGDLGIVTYNTPRMAIGDRSTCGTANQPRSLRSTTTRSTGKRAESKPPSSWTPERPR